MDAIKAQLKERLPFVPAPDYCVASLLWDLSRLYERKTKEPGAGQEVYHLAMDYLGEVQSVDLLTAYVGSERRAGGRFKASHSFRQKLADSAPVALVIWGIFPLPFLPIAFLRHRKNFRIVLSELLVRVAVGGAIVLPIWMGMVILDRPSEVEKLAFGFGIILLTALLTGLVYRGMRTKFPKPTKA
jgi:hypothetical protein